MYKYFLGLTVFTVVGSCASNNWRDDCQKYYSSERGDYIKCVSDRKAREKAKAEGLEDERTVGLQSLDLPRGQQDLGRNYDTSDSSDESSPD